MAQAENEMTFDVSADKYFNAVTQYEKYPEFVDGMQKVIVKRDGATIVGDYEFSMMSKDMSYKVKINEDKSAGTVNWSLISSEFFKVNNGAWKIEVMGADQCKVHYSLEVEFSFSVPGFILKTMVKGALPTMMKSFYERAKQA